MTNEILKFVKEHNYKLTEKEELYLLRFQETGIISFELGIDGIKMLDIIESFNEESIDKSNK